MLVREEEAKTKWCPYGREVCDAGHGSANRDYDGDILTACIASNCMAWKWFDHEPEEREPESHFFECEDSDLDNWRTNEPERPADVPHDWSWVPISGPEDNIAGGFWREPDDSVSAANATKRAERKGYCGLAGKP